MQYQYAFHRLVLGASWFMFIMADYLWERYTPKTGGVGLLSMGIVVGEPRLLNVQRKPR